MDMPDYDYTPIDFAVVRARCHECGRDVAFEKTLQEDVVVRIGGTDVSRLGIRKCPACTMWSFIRVNSLDGAVVTYPKHIQRPEVEGLPEEVLESYQEALACFGHGLYRAAAILTRRTLEVVCSDQGAEGETLVKRLKKLREQVTLPEALFEGAESLRLLGNDAAHIEARYFGEMGHDELDVGLRFLHAILEGVYGYAELLEGLQNLRRSGDDSA